MTISEALLTAMVALLAAIIGGLIQARLSQSFERERFVKQQRVAAYLDYMRGIGQLSHAETVEQANLAHALIAEARGRIGLFGGSRTIAALARAFAHKGDLHSPEAWPDHAEMIQAMRADCLDNEPVNDRDVFEVLYGSGPRKEIE